MKSLAILLFVMLLPHVLWAQPIEDGTDAAFDDVAPEEWYRRGAFRTALHPSAHDEHSVRDEPLFSVSFPDSAAEWSIDYFSQNIEGFAEVTDLQIAPDNQVVAAGYRSKYPYDTETFTVRYDSGGEILWMASEEAITSPAGMALGTDGAVYVAGTSWSSETTTDIFLAKYDSAGAKRWERRFDGPAPSDPAGATALAAHPDGGIVVAGTVPGDLNTDAVVILRYSPDGQELWRYYYDDDRYASEDRPLRILTNAAGAVVVVNRDGTVVKLAADGTEAWVNRDDRGMTTQAFDAALDESGNVFVFGRNSSELETRKLSADGMLEWAQHFEASSIDGDILLYGSGVVVATLGFGQNLGGIGVSTVVIGYSLDGDERWRYLQNDPAFQGSVGIPDVLVQQTDSTFYLIGTMSMESASTVVTRFDNTGIPEWSRHYLIDGEATLPTAAAADSEGGFRLGLSIDGSAATIALDDRADPVWITSHEGTPRSDDAIADVAADASGRLYLAGSTWTSAGGEDFLVTSIGPTGEVRWVERFDGGAARIEQAVRIAVDEEGNVFAAGPSADAEYDYLVLALDADGTLRWHARYDGGSSDQPADIVPDGTGGAFVTGSSTDAASDVQGILTIRYDAAGEEVWRDFATGDADGRTHAAAMARTPDGGIVVSGTVQPSGQTEHYVTISYSAGGDERWRAVYSDRTGHAADAATDAEGHVYVVGSTDSNDEITTVAYDSTGGQLWSGTHRTGYLITFGQRVEIGADGMFVTGTRTLFYGRNGTERWVRDRPAFSVGSDLAVDAHRRAVISGLDVDGVRQRVGIEMLDASGERIFERWQPQRTTGPLETQGAVFGAVLEPFNRPTIALTRSGKLFIVNNVAPLSRLGAFTVTKYGPDQLPLSAGKHDLPQASFYLHAPYPNPSEDAVTISYEMRHPSEVVIEVFDLLGRRVAALERGLAPAGRRSIRWDASGLAAGVYVVRIEAGGIAHTRKLVLAR